MATKRLARQLGLIRRKSVAAASENPGRPKFKQLFDYLIIIDFESTCWNDGKRHQTQEIIEFPAVLLNTSTGEIESEFHAYVQPQEYPVLSEFCMELTGIKQAQVDEGIPLKICLSQFCKWIQKIQQEKKITFATGVPDLSTSEVKFCAFVTWSDWDLGVCLEYECKRKQLLKPVFLNSWIDLRVTYKTFYSRNPKGLSGALQEVGIEFLGREHSGLDDSRNTAFLALKMIRDGCLMKITRSLHKVPTKKNSNISVRNLSTSQIEETTAGNSSIQGPSVCGRETKMTTPYRESPAEVSRYELCKGAAQRDDLKPKRHAKAGREPCVSPCPSVFCFAGALPCPSFSTPAQKQVTEERPAKPEPLAVGSGLVLVSTTLSSVNHVSDMEVSSALDCLSMLADWEEVALLPGTEPEQNTDCTPPTGDSDPGTALSPGGRVTVLEEPEMLSYEDLGGTGETPQKSETSKSVVYKSPHTTIYNVKETKDPSSDVSNFKLPECKSNVKATVPYPSILGQHLHLSGTKRNPSRPPALPVAKKQSFTIHEENPRVSDGSPVRSSSQKVPSSVLTPTVDLREPWKRGKMTPPLCRCGRRAKRLVVSNSGPNHGRVFYCCPLGKYQENRKCGYFKWEHTLQRERSSSMMGSRSSGGLTGISPETSPVCHQTINVSTKNSLRLRPSMRN